VDHPPELLQPAEHRPVARLGRRMSPACALWVRSLRVDPAMLSSCRRSSAPVPTAFSSIQQIGRNLNFARFDAKLEQRVTALAAKVEQRIAALEVQLERRFVALEAKLDTKLDAAVAQHAFAQLDAKIEQRFAEARLYLEKGLKDQTRWLILALFALFVPLIGILLRG